MTLGGVERLINSKPGAFQLHEVEPVSVALAGCKEAMPRVMMHLKFSDGSFAEVEMPLMPQGSQAQGYKERPSGRA